MNTKQILSSVLCLSIILVFAGCDWCGCCKQKEEAITKAAPTSETKTPETAPKAAVEPKAEETKAPEVAPKVIMPIEPHPMPIAPKISMPVEHPAPKIPAPVEHPIPGPKVFEPKMPMAPKIFEPKIPMPKA